MSKPNEPPPVIDWAIEHARASLRVGLSVPEIESRLVARGLDPMIAEAAVTHALSDRIREPNGSEIWKRIYWAIVIVVSAGSILFALCVRGVMAAALTLIFVILLLLCAWFLQRLDLRGKALFRCLGLILLLFFLACRMVIFSHLR
jgi:hypothetical protein